MSDPRRWLDDENELTRDERRVLEAGIGAEAPSGAKRAVFGAVLAKLPPLPGGGSPSGVDGAAGPGAAGSGAGTGIAGAAGKLALLAVAKPAAMGFVLGVATTLGWVGVRSALEPADPPRGSSLSPAPVGAPGPLPPPRTVAEPSFEASDDAQPTASSNALPAVTAKSRTPAPEVAATPAPHAPDLPSTRSFPETNPEAAARASVESRRLAEARAMLRSGDARAALAALSLQRRDFPRGVLVEEREALTIEALLAAGDRTGARSLAREFLERHPTSPHAAAARRALE